RAMDPLTLRELQGLSRRSVLDFSRVVYVGLIGLAVYAWWVVQGDRLRTLSPSQAANLGRQLFNGLTILQMLLVGLGATIGAADMILKETRSRTLSLVCVTPMTGVAIVWGKWKAAMAQALTLMLCGLPGLAICAYLGAIGPWGLAWTVSLTLALAMIGATLGLRHAVLCKTTTGATVLAILEFAAPGLVLWAIAGIYPLFQPVLIYVHPIGSLIGVTDRSFLGGWGEYGWISSTIVSMLLSFWLIRRTGRSLLELGSRVEEPDPDLTEDRGLHVAGAAVRSWVTEMRVWDDQPLLWKELATRPGVRLEPFLGKPLLWMTFLLLALMWIATNGKALEFLAPVQGAVLAAVVIQGAGLFTRDRETRWNEIILCTPLSTRELLRAKLTGGLIAPESLYVLGVGLVVLLGWSVPSGLLQAVIGLGATALFLLFAYLLAALASLLGRTMRGAFLSAGAIVALVLLVVPYRC